ncbi:MAG: hypothetical protein AAF762_15105, partial [Pseudomonadota bacterium]
MADYALAPDGLKKAIAQARKKEMPFAYCPGPDVKDDVFTMDKLKKPEFLGKAMRGEGAGTKVCYG